MPHIVVLLCALSLLLPAQPVRADGERSAPPKAFRVVELQWLGKQGAHLQLRLLLQLQRPTPAPPSRLRFHLEVAGRLWADEAITLEAAQWRVGAGGELWLMPTFTFTPAQAGGDPVTTLARDHGPFRFTGELCLAGERGGCYPLHDAGERLHILK